MTSVIKDITLATFMDSCERRTLQNMSGDPLLHCDMDDEEEVEMAVLTDIFVATSLERRTSSFIKFDAQELLQYVKGDDAHRLIARVLMSKRIKRLVKTTKDGNLKIRKKKILEVVEFLCFTSEEIVEYLTFYYFEEESSLNWSDPQLEIIGNIPGAVKESIGRMYVYGERADYAFPSFTTPEEDGHATPISPVVTFDIESDFPGLDIYGSPDFSPIHDPCDDSVEAAVERAKAITDVLQQMKRIPLGLIPPPRNIGRGLLRPIIYLETPGGDCEETFLHHINAPYPDTKQ